VAEACLVMYEVLSYTTLNSVLKITVCGAKVL